MDTSKAKKESKQGDGEGVCVCVRGGGGGLLCNSADRSLDNNREDLLVWQCIPKKEPYLRKACPSTTTSAPVIVHMYQLQHVHSLLNLFTNSQMRNFPLAGCWQQLLRSNPEILEWVSGFKIGMNSDWIKEGFHNKHKWNFKNQI